MANEGIMALPETAAMPGGDESQSPMVTSMDSYDAAKTALGRVDPNQLAMLTQSLRESIGELELTPGQLASLIELFEYVSQNPGEYPAIREKLIRDGIADEEDLPPEYDPEFLGAALAVLNELKLSLADGAQAPMMAGPPVEGMQPAMMADGGLADVAQYLASQGRRGDTMLAHITPGEARLLQARGGAGTINPVTGLPEFFLKKLFKGVAKAVKSVLKSPIGRIVATVALATVLGPAGVGLSMGTAAGLAGAGTTLMAGGSVKEALIAGAMGYVGGGGTIMGASPVSAIGQYLPGAAGSALNTGLATGVIGTGVGMLGGMKPSDALRMGMMSGASAAALQGLSGAQAAENAQFRQAAGMEPAQGIEQLGGVPEGTIPQTSLSPEILAEGMEPRMIGTAQDLLASSPATTPTMTPSTVPTGAPGPVGTAPNVLAEGTIPLEKPGFFDSMTAGAKNFYNEYLSPSRPGLPADASLLRKYGPLAAAGTAVIGAAGGMKASPSNPNPAFNRDYTGIDYIRDNPNMFQGGLDRSYQVPQTPPNVMVPTPRYSTMPASAPGMVMPTGITNQPAGVAQPYNIAGLYGVPLLYGQRVSGYARGGSAEPRRFPRKTGAINGPGTGTSDSIPAMLSDGEFVFTAKAVRNAGKGSRRKGAARMYKLMKMLEGGPIKA